MSATVDVEPDATRILTGHAYSTSADEAYWRHLLRECRELAWQRRQKLRSFATAADWEQYGRTVRETFRRALGPMPERTPLNPRLIDVLKRDGYVVEKLLIESQPNFFVTVNLYLPAKINAPAPAILNPIGHWPLSKAQDVVQARGIGLARLGYVALIYDPPGQGERSQFWDAEKGEIPIGLGCPQHCAVNNPCYLIGQTIINHMVWDGVRMLDYLETRPEVDASRIGVTGASGGGTYTMFLNAFDERIKAAVPVCSMGTYERLLSEGRIGDPCFDPVGSYRDDLDMADVLMCAVPNPVRIIASTYDFYPLGAAREVYLDVLDAYTALGIPERVDLFETPARHDYNKPMREAMYAWFNRWLDHDADAIEAPFEPEPPERLWCTSTGQLLTSVGGETVLSLNRARTREVSAPAALPATVTEAEADRDRVRAAVPEVLSYAYRSAYSEPHTLDETASDGVTIEQLVYEGAPDLPVPVLLYRPTGAGPHPTVLYLDDRGKGADTGAHGLIPSLARAGYMVAAFDARGWGETAWWHRRPIGDDPFGWLGNDSMLTYACYLLGDWPVTQRVIDTVQMVDLLVRRPDVDSARIGVIGRGGGAMVALHAAALDDRIKGVAVVEMLAAFRAITGADTYVHAVGSFIPGVLLRYDLPDLLGALVPAPTLILNPIDAMGDVLCPEAAADTYAGAYRMRELLGCPASLRVRSCPERTVAADEIIDWAARLGRA